MAAKAETINQLGGHRRQVFKITEFEELKVCMMFDYVGSDIILYYTNKYCSILIVLILILIIILCIHIFHFNDNGSSVLLLYVYVNYK